MAISDINFLQATQSAYGRNRQTNGYHQGYNGQYGAPSTLPTVQSTFKPTAEDYELASAIASGEYKVEQNPFVTRPQRTSEKPGFEGFSLPENNGTGELRPALAGRGDEIENCPWEEYYA